MALTDKLSTIAESIRNKTGSTDKMTLDEMATNIDNIKSGDISAFINSDNVVTGGNTYDGYFYLKCIKKLPSVDIPNEVTNMAYAFANLQSITEIPNIDVSKCMRYEYAFYNCTSLLKVPKLNYANVQYTQNMFSGCKSLTTEAINAMNLPKLKDCGYMFYGCTSMTEIPAIDISEINCNGNGNTSNLFGNSGLIVADLSNMKLPSYNQYKQHYSPNWFYLCKNLIEIKNWNTNYLVNAEYMFQEIPNLKKMCALDFSNVINVRSVMPNSGVPALEDFGGFINLGKAYTTNSSSNDYNYKLDMSKEIKLTHESLMNVINGLYDIASAGVATQQLILGSTNLAKLTEDEIAIATTKGWSVS